MDRVYFILDVVEGKHSEAVQSLQANPGVQWVDVLEGQWDIITAIQASNRMRLAKHLVRALAVVENITEDLQVLPTCDGSSMESKVERFGKVRINKTKNFKKVQYVRDGSNIPGSA